MHRTKGIWVLAALWLAAAPAQAQDLGTIAGQVIDEANAITLPGVPVELNGPVSQIEYTDLDGNYRFQVPAGTYELKVVMAGYAEQTVTLDVAAGELTRPWPCRWRRTSSPSRSPYRRPASRQSHQLPRPR